MEKYKYLLFFTWYALFVTTPTAGNSSMKKIAQSKMQFIKISPSARAAALGDAFTSYAGDPNAIFYNPAGMAFVEGTGVVFNNNSWIAEISHLSGVFCYNKDALGTFTFSFISMDYGEFERTIVDEHAWVGYQNLGAFSIMEYALGLGYARKITNRLSLGGQLKYLYQNLGDIQSFAYIGTEFEEHKTSTFKDNALAFDFGTYYDTEIKGITISMAMQNFANQPLPLIFRYGMSVKLHEVFFPGAENNALRLSGDILQSKDYGDGYQFGLEYALYEQYFLRTGYKITSATEEDFSFGAGTNLMLKGLKIQIDYSYSKFGVLKDINRLSFGIRF